ncbi:hypothetical protein [Nocardia transvalensis]|uniref:hypothetical protein n=1 Tax=Nocardia transvalensis TaxID=37333 RepID=UPI001895035E|nr:hypothetical protein [Nocardia transvalensis]MBF6326963.1 hypothetical protein [Nocardia transvalensis]
MFDDDRTDESSDSRGGEAPDVAARSGRPIDGSVDVGWLRPHASRVRGRPRASTVVLVLIFIAVLVLYLQIRPGG